MQTASQKQISKTKAVAIISATCVHDSGRFDIGHERSLTEGTNRRTSQSFTPGGIKLQDEGHDVRYRNIWIKELQLDKPDADFTE